ncbi:GNAT family N-acetyltransferase [Neobacillus kokaensis]|uniref:Ribosomal-protein-serine acetyltransferase n=1 Tax=Neobacillus kokaensis TaxID=2759023 RepID=A0ABQ3N4P3_9BACI|nr:GNAT family protein [Neobacillus kokaensis]GHH98587.1 ribosomal-protein-serine acetyltransferase [Neobacillus kokaensis]
MFTLKVDHEIELLLLQRHHAMKMFQLVEDNRAHLREWLPWVDNMRTPYDFENLIPIWLNQFAENSAYNLGILYRGELVGAIGIHQIDWYNKIASVGYYLTKDAEGKGIISRSVKALLNYAYFELGLNRIEIRCGVKNKKSRAIPERLAFIREGTIRDGELLNGYYHDIIIYSMLAREWNGMHRAIK